MRIVALVALLLASALLLAPQAQAQSYTRSHPDQYLRWLGIQRMEAGEAGAAVQHLQESARFGDKVSQLLVAVSYLNGEGVERDPALAYAWADLAAERGYPFFLRVREAIWAQLSAAEQARALQVGQGLYDEYGDAVAKPRLERRLARGLRARTGTRTGANTSAVGVQWMTDGSRALFRTAMATGDSTGGGSVVALSSSLNALPGRSSDEFIGPADLYADHHWIPELYWAEQDAAWRAVDAEVTIGDLIQLGE